MFPGDELLPGARAQATHAIDIDAPPERVWPWLVQMGRGRGGWYSWDLLDNGGVRSADRIVPALQTLAVGDFLAMDAKGSAGASVLLLDPARALVLGDSSLLPGRRKPASTAPRATWAFSLEPTGDHGTHLAVRVRAEYAPSLAAELVRRVVTVLHDVMERKQLRTIKHHAEGGRRGGTIARIRDLVGEGHRIALLTLPFAAVGVAAAILWPSIFRMGFGAAETIAGAALLAVGVPLWLTAVVQILVRVPRGQLITSGPYALVLHPIYTSVALLVIPGCGLLLDSWLGFAIGAVLYAFSRRFARNEERELAARFPQEYRAYRERVLWPWL